MTALHTSALTSLPLLARGKVRDNYAVGDDRILMVASDRISAFDVIMGEAIPGKGELLTQMALFWFKKLGHICPNHLTGEAPESVVSADEVGQVVNGFNRVLTDLEQQQEGLKESEERYRTAFQTIPDAVNITRLSDGSTWRPTQASRACLAGPATRCWAGLRVIWASGIAGMTGNC